MNETIIKINKKLLNLKERKIIVYERIKELEYTIGMSLEEYEELNKLYDEYYEILIKIKLLEEIL